MPFAWRIQERTDKQKNIGFWIWSDDERKPVCENFPTNGPFDPKTKLAWAKLIAAAPQMQQALEEILEKGLTRATVEKAIKALENSK